MAERQPRGWKVRVNRLFEHQRLRMLFRPGLDYEVSQEVYDGTVESELLGQGAGQGRWRRELPAHCPGAGLSICGAG